MALEIGQTAADDRIRLRVSRGETLLARFELYEDGGAAGSCAQAVQGDPRDLSSFSTLVAAGRVTGTNAALPVSAVFIDKGAVNRPAVITLRAEAVDLEAVFAEGAYESFAFSIVAVKPGEFRRQLSGLVDVDDSAFGATR